MLEGRLARAGALARRCARRPPALDDPDWAALLDAVTVQETRLFRQPAQFAALAPLLPGLAPPGVPLRLLSAGCATGEEAWSLAALAHGAAPAFDVLGLDLCRPALEAAREGRFDAGLGDPLALVPPALRPLLAGGPAPALRRAVRFARATLLAPPPGRFHVIFCRNVLIYLTDAAREGVVRQLTDALEPGGILGLGPTDRPPAGLRPLGEALWRRDG